MEERERLIAQLDDAREVMRAMVAEVDVDMDIYPPWKIKQVLAHIAGWDDAAIAALKAHAAGEPLAAPAIRGIDHYNAETVSTRQALSYEKIVREWEFARETFKEILREMPAEKFGERLLFPWGGGGSIADLVAIFAHHERQHAQEIRELATRPEA